MLHAFRIVLPILLLSTAVVAQGLKPIELPKPDTTGGKPLMQVLKNRHSSREFSADTLPMPVLSNLLWAACGINRTGEGKRTAPSAMNWQEIDVYVATAHGLFLFDPIKHALQPVLSEDIREKTGMQPFVKDVPVNLVYVADMAKVNKASDADKSFYTAADAALVSENVYLYCASEGLSTVVRGSVDREALAKVMKLRADQKIIFAQSVGYPKK
ncbi:MAG: nitroreductase family protein [candidate division Zixibacteria bacterium]|nr:nitroreductase family protein [candidate division Zixibacteria bacterium]